METIEAEEKQCLQWAQETTILLRQQRNLQPGYTKRESTIPWYFFVTHKLDNRVIKSIL